MFSGDNNEYYHDFYNEYNTNMMPTTSFNNGQPRLSLDSGLGLTNDSFYSSDLNESQLMDITAATASDVSMQSGPLIPDSLLASPPTKWARIRTPPNRKKPATEECSLFSPPSQKKMRASFTSPSSSMKTPESFRKSIRISSPSPFKVTFSKTPLKLSNDENSTGIHIDRTGTYYNKKVSGSASKRCLLPARPDGFTLLGSPNSDVLDFPLETTNFESIFGELPTESPTKIARSLGYDDGSMDYHQYAGMIESGNFPSVSRSSNMETVRKTSVVRSASRNLLKETKEKESAPVDSHHPFIPMIKQDVSDPRGIENSRTKKKLSAVNQKQLPVQSRRRSVKDSMQLEAKEKEINEWKSTPFETPKKDVQLYSGRWLVISTGRTLEQKELLSDAKVFLKNHPEPKPTSIRPASRQQPQKMVPTIARVTLFKHRYRSLLV